MAEDGFAVTLYREGGNWQCDLLPPAVMTDLGTCVAVLRQQPPEGGPMALVDVEDEFFLALRLAPGGAVRLLLSDVTAAAEWDLARQALRRLGEAMPATSTPGPTGPTGPAGPAGPAGPTGQFGQAALAGPGEFGDEAVPAGDLGLFADLGLPEADLRAVLDDTELYADEMLAVITRRIGVGSAYARVVDSLSS